jgi:hypothetical protein
MELRRSAAVAEVDVAALLSGDGHAVGGEARLRGKGAAGSFLTVKAVTDGDPDRITAGGGGKLTAAAGGGADDGLAHPAMMHKDGAGGQNFKGWRGLVRAE